MPRIPPEIDRSAVEVTTLRRFATILADPPWPYNTANGRPAFRTKGEVEQLGYRTMVMADILNLDVRALAADDAHLYLWTTNAFMVEAHEVAEAWGFKPKTIITWVKIKQGKPDDDLEPSMATGYWFRSCTEHCLFAVRGTLRLTDRNVPNVFLHPRLPHSVKPEAFRKMIEVQSPAPRLELFARRVADGWDRWGNEVVSTASLGTIRAGHVPIRVSDEILPSRPKRIVFGANGVKANGSHALS